MASYPSPRPLQGNVSEAKKAIHQSSSRLRVLRILHLCEPKGCPRGHDHCSIRLNQSTRPIGSMVQFVVMQRHPYRP
jgi:hypothetical protein